MSEPVEPPARVKQKELEDKIKALEKFCKDLIQSLEYAEGTHKLILLPEGTYFGKTIE